MNWLQDEKPQSPLTNRINSRSLHSPALPAGRQVFCTRGTGARNHRFQNKILIPTGAQRSGGTCCFTLGHSECAVGESPPGSVTPLTQTADPYATPDFLWNLVPLAHFTLL